uniref:Lipocalin/cytosolic fatty-acid binding domain-containing protein n=1 Tax=Castor canadensis TaxID=51338 RepID=A0A8C0X861_CASCN
RHLPAGYMEGKVLLTLLGLCMGLVAGTQDAVLKEFDFVKFSGLWYEIAFASKMGMPSLPLKVEKMGAVVVKLEGNQLTLTTTYYNEKGCVIEQVRALPGDAPGRFKVIRTAGDKDVEIVATDSKSYTIMDVFLQMAGTVHRVMKLYSRSLDHNEEALKKFHMVAQERGLTGPDIHLLKNDCRETEAWPKPDS